MNEDGSEKQKQRQRSEHGKLLWSRSDLQSKRAAAGRTTVRLGTLASSGLVGGRVGKEFTSAREKSTSKINLFQNPNKE
jgi:hypothetical protein